MAAERPYGEFRDFYSVSPEYFGYILEQRFSTLLIAGSVTHLPRQLNNHITSYTYTYTSTLLDEISPYL
jgi:hypothetical protein